MRDVEKRIHLVFSGRLVLLLGLFESFEQLSPLIVAAAEVLQYCDGELIEVAGFASGQKGLNQRPGAFAALE